MAKLAFILSFATWCFEKCIKFLNKTAYIQIALTGKPFCKSAFNAFLLIVRNAARVAVLGMTGFLVNFLIKLSLIAATVFIGYFLLQAMHDDISSPIFPLIVFFILGFLTASFVSSLFSMAVDTILQCLIIDEELNGKGEKTNTPTKLIKFVQRK